MLSHLFKTIFVHIPKTAGQSVEHVFLARHGLDWEGRAPLLLRYNPDRNVGPERLAHLWAREYVSCGYVSPKVFSEYFKFAIVRDPYERAISEWLYRGAKVPLETFMRTIPEDSYRDQARHMSPQVDFLSGSDGSIIVDRIARFETLSADLSEIFLTIFGEAIDIPHVNRSKTAGPKKTDLSQEAKELIHRRFEKDFDVLGYPK